MSEDPAPSAGGWQPASPHDPAVHDAAQTAVRALSTRAGARYVVEEIHSAETQVVAGTNYRVAFHAARLVGDELTTRQHCTATVFDQPWTGTVQVTELDCRVNAGAPA